MFGLGVGELLVILVIVLIIFGPGKLPDIGNAIGRGVREFRKASTDLEDTIRGESKATPPPSDTKSGEGSSAAPSTPGSSTPETK